VPFGRVARNQLCAALSLNAAGGGSLRLTATNSGPTVDLTITDNRRDGHSRTLRLRTGARVTHQVGARGTGWYDISITSGGDPSFLRRIGGHLENGRSGTSDPALAGR
jgi:phospholipase C